MQKISERAKLLAWMAMARAYPPESQNSTMRSLAAKLDRAWGPADMHYGGVIVRVGPSDLLDRFVLLKRHLNPFFTSAVSQYCQEDGDIVIDVGANSGVLSLLAARHRVRVHAFEPSEREVRRLFENLRRNDCNRVTVHPIALSNTAGEIDFHISVAGNSGQNSFSPIMAKSTLQKARTERLDTLLSVDELAKVRVVKIDAEGAEVCVLAGAEGAMAALQQAAFVVEVSPGLLAQGGHSAQDIYDFFARFSMIGHYGSRSEEQWEDVFYNPARLNPPMFSSAI